ncbi:MAG: hypothetical protein IKV94_00510 [Clostridia bacterium]|nr:hypothetical protein [Clostridia bacterium]
MGKEVKEVNEVEEKVEVNEVSENNENVEDSDVTALFILTIALFVVVVGLTIYSCFI